MPSACALTAAHKACSRAALAALRLDAQPVAHDTTADAAPSPPQVEVARALQAAQEAMRQAEAEQTTLHMPHPLDLHTDALGDADGVAGVVEDELCRLDPIAECQGASAVSRSRAREKIPTWTAVVAQWRLRVQGRVTQEILSAELRVRMISLWILPAAWRG